jgi:hypothetical protein
VAPRVNSDHFGIFTLQVIFVLDLTTILETGRLSGTAMMPAARTTVVPSLNPVPVIVKAVDELVTHTEGEMEVTVGFGAKTVNATAFDVPSDVTTTTGPVTGKVTPAIGGTPHHIRVSLHDP